jgi:hypothetical protein
MTDKTRANMSSEYLAYIKEDKQLHRIVEPVLSEIENLNSQQVDTLVFYLKSLHNYNPESENHVAYYDRFSEQLNKLRNSESQMIFQSKAARLMLFAMITGSVAGVVFIGGIVAALSGVLAWGAALIFGALGLFVFAEVKFGTPALNTAKEQDRRYFLESIRSARACNELDWAGLFSHNGTTKPGPQSDVDIEQTRRRIADLTKQLRAALYNDEYMQYSHPRHR